MEYTIEFEFWDDEDRTWHEDETDEARRFNCPKKDIKKEVKKAVKEMFDDQTVRVTSIKITDYYPTTDCEI